MTVAGAHGKFAATLATSTPRRSVAPGLNLFSPNDNEFNFNEKGNDSLFGTAYAPEKEILLTSNNFGSSLQKRLSLVSENLKNLNVLYFFCFYDFLNLICFNFRL